MKTVLAEIEAAVYMSTGVVGIFISIVAAIN